MMFADADHSKREHVSAQPGKTIYVPHPAIAPGWIAFVDEAAAFPKGRNDDQVDAMTQALNRLRTVSGSFSVPESQIIVDPFPISEPWPRAFGMAVTPAGVAALWGARDPSGTIYLYAEHLHPHAEPSQNARAIKVLGDWIPGVINVSSITGSQPEKDAIAQIYPELGLNIETSAPGRRSCGLSAVAAVSLEQAQGVRFLVGVLGRIQNGR